MKKMFISLFVVGSIIGGYVYLVVVISDEPSVTDNKVSTANAVDERIEKTVNIRDSRYDEGHKRYVTKGHVQEFTYENCEYIWIDQSLHSSGMTHKGNCNNPIHSFGMSEHK